MFAATCRQDTFVLPSVRLDAGKGKSGAGEDFPEFGFAFSADKCVAQFCSVPYPFGVSAETFPHFHAGKRFPGVFLQEQKFPPSGADPLFIGNFRHGYNIHHLNNYHAP